MNEFYGYQKGDFPKYFYENQVLNDTLTNAVNNLTPEETIKVNDVLAKLRMGKYFQSVDERPIKFASIRGGTMYNTMAVTSATFWIRDMVKEYLYQARIECDDKAGFDSLE